MSVEPGTPVSVMAGKGAYNRNSAIPAAGGALAIPFLARAAEKIALDDTDRPLVIADYGSSEGRNSLAPMRAAIAILRRRAGSERPIQVYHTDLPENDFNSLFDVLAAHADRYDRGQANVFPAAIGRSFYESVLPPATVDLGWSSYAAVWLSRIPQQIPNHFVPRFSTGAVREAFDRQAAKDWARFLSLRAAELCPGGRLVVALPSLADDGSTAFAPIFDVANDVLAEFVRTGFITSKERLGMTIGTNPRRRADLLAPFASGPFHGLAVEHCETVVAPDFVWSDFERDHDAQALARKRAGFFRAVFAPAMAQTLAQGRNEAEREAFAARLEDEVALRLADQPARIDHLVGIISLSKPS